MTSVTVVTLLSSTGERHPQRTCAGPMWNQELRAPLPRSLLNPGVGTMPADSDTCEVTREVNGQKLCHEIQLPHPQ